MAVVVSIDAGTTGVRSFALNEAGEQVAIAYREFTQLYPQPGWVEHDPEDIWKAVQATLADLVSLIDEPIAAIGITDQRETVLAWDLKNGAALSNAIVWQDRRTASVCDELKAKGYEELIQEKTGLIIDAYFSASKIKWILDNVPEARALAQDDKLCFGTVDTWLIYKLTQGEVFVTDVSNASRTMIFNIHIFTKATS